MFILYMKMELLFTIIAYFSYFKELNGVGKVINKQKSQDTLK